MSGSDAGRELVTLLERRGIGSHTEEALRLRGYLALLEKWNRRVNLVSSAAWRILEPLFDEAIWACRFQSKADPVHLDIGSGAGFPAIPLRILVPGMSLQMVESRSKRAIFLETAVKELNLENCSVSALRISDFLDLVQRGFWDTVSWKGLKLNSADLAKLRDLSGSDTSFWLFHGSDIPVEAPEEAMESFQLQRRECIPGRKNSHLSIFKLSHVKRSFT